MLSCPYLGPPAPNGRDEGVFGAMAHKQGNFPNHRHSGRRGDSRDGTCSESPATAGRDFDGKTSAAGDFFTRSGATARVFFAPLLHSPGPSAADYSAQRVGVHVASLQMPPARRAVGGAPVQQAGVVHHHQHAGFQPEIAAAAG